MATQITQHFTLEELTASATAKARRIPNNPNTAAIINLTALCVEVLEPLRTWWGREVKIGSGYRCRALNTAVGGVSNSQHMTGQAADLCIDGDMNKAKAWFSYIRDHLQFDQLILEHNTKGSYWIHVSYDARGNNRHNIIGNLLKR